MCTSAPSAVVHVFVPSEVFTLQHLWLSPGSSCSRAGTVHGSEAAHRDRGSTSHAFPKGTSGQWGLTETQLLPKYHSRIQKSERKGSEEAADFHTPVKKKSLLHKWSSSTEQAPTWLHQYIFSAVGIIHPTSYYHVLASYQIVLSHHAGLGNFFCCTEHCCACFEYIFSVWFLFVVDASLTVTFNLK